MKPKSLFLYTSRRFNFPNQIRVSRGGFCIRRKNRQRNNDRHFSSSAAACCTRATSGVVTCISLFCAAGYHSSRTGNGVPRRKPHSDGTDADGGHPREGFRIQSV